MVTRRTFLKMSLLASAGLALPPGIKVVSAKGSAKVKPAIVRQQALVGTTIPGGTLDPTSIGKYATPLVIPPAMPRTSVLKEKGGAVDYYEISVRQLVQQILPAGMPTTTVWGYGSVNHPGTYNYPSFTIEARMNQRVRVKWINELVDANGDYLPHLLPVDPTLHWANPGGGMTGRDSRPVYDPEGPIPGPYTGPVPIVTHVHGANTNQESDGYAEAWYLPDAKNITSDFAKTGTFYDYFKANSAIGANWGPGFSLYEYPNVQNATTLWYHDHALGMTRLNVYAGPAGFYLLRGGPTDLITGLPGPAPKEGDKPGRKYYEIPLAIQDRSFNSDGSLFFPDSRAFFDGATAENPGYHPKTDLSPIWNPEFFGNTMLVNGNTWPTLKVEPRRYRFRLLNGCNARFLLLRMCTTPVDPTMPINDPANPVALPFWQIGAEGGFLPAPIQLDEVLMSPAERADVIVDFTGLAAGTKIYLVNLGPDEPYGGGVPGVDFAVSDPQTTGQVMMFDVSLPLLKVDASLPPNQLVLPVIPGLPAPTNNTPRQVSLNEEMSAHWDGPAEALLGTMDGTGVPLPKMWDAPLTENPALGATEDWEIYNFTADAHPIHIHLVEFQVVNRELLEPDPLTGEPAQPVVLTGTVLPPDPDEAGYKDTVIAYPGQVTRVRMTFNRAGLFVWHCHIVDHEDNEMMRPYHVGPIPMGLPLTAM